MKNYFYVFMLLAFTVSCKDKPAETKVETEITPEEELDVTKSVYPEDLTKVFDAHGTIEAWNEMATLEFSVQHTDGYEITTTDLKDRYAFIEMPKHTMGFDGELVWIKNRGKGKYQGEPQLYYNKMFYFYAMPFILADDGTIYGEAEPLTFEGKTYPGIQISYEDGVGTTSGDAYVMYYDADTHKMAWLAYTEMLDGKEPSQSWHFIKYSIWQEVEGLLLPETMVWYKAENMQPTTVEKEINFVSPMLTTVKMGMRVYQMPEDAEMIQ